VSEAFVAKILQSLVKKKMINSIKGPNGGFYVEAGQRLIPLIEVVKAIDGNDLFTTCGLGIKNCSEKRPCPIHNEFSAIRNDIMKMLKANTIQGLAARLTEGESFLLKR
jgi:Rrf2 family protein